ncbi:hypothetical protein MKY91_09325 [Alkalicoccobacillus gibsonii]|uniref:Uncharacterized protein n=1 Tax=Alkalicoccobacillus gibsonii TaxID=79881 RepID=A0ABU9VHM8_9BACI
MLAELVSTSTGLNKRISAKYVTDEISKEKAKELIPELIENVKKDNQVVNLYLFEDLKQKKEYNCYCRVQWASENAMHVPPIKHDEIIAGDIFIDWISYHDAFKELIKEHENE